MRSRRRSNAKPADAPGRRPEELLPADLLALLDHLAEEIAAEYLCRLVPAPGNPNEIERTRELEVDK